MKAPAAPISATVMLPPKLIPVFTKDARYRGAYGGRGSGKTRNFAKMAAIHGYRCAEAGQEGQIVCGREFQNSLADSSMEEVKRAIRSEPWLDAYYEIGEKFIRTRNRRVRFTFSGLRYSIDNLKSASRILLMWVDEAEKVMEGSWRKAIPSVREAGSEIWLTWNPESDMSATHKRFREDPPEGAKIVELNWRDNPWFPAVLEAERLEDQAKRPDTYEHIWEGGFLNVLDGAYFAREMRAAENEGRITSIPVEPLMPVFTFWDLGISDDMAIWLVQPVGKELRVIAAHSDSGYGIDHYIGWLMEFGDRHRVRWAKNFAPHDIEVRELSTGKSRRDAAARLGIVFETVERPQNKQEAIEALRRLMPRLWFDKSRAALLIKALRSYHREFDEKRQVFLSRPQHDWSSNLADAGQTFALAWDDNIAGPKRPVLTARRRPGGWMGV